jgi:hypothetical protein
MDGLKMGNNVEALRERERGNDRAALKQGGTANINYHGDCGRFLTKNEGRSPFTSKGKGNSEGSDDD